MNILPSTGNSKTDDKIRRIVRWLVGVASLLAVLFFIFHIMRVGLAFWMYGALARWVTSNLGFDYYLAQFVAILFSSCLTLAIPYIIWFLLIGRKKWIVAFSLIATTGIITILMYTVGDKVYFDRTTGKPLRYYADTPSGLQFSFTEGFDPRYGIKFEAYTRDVALGLSKKTTVDDQEKIKSFALGNFDHQWFNNCTMANRIIGPDIFLGDDYTISLEKSVNIKPFTIVSATVVNKGNGGYLKFSESSYIIDQDKISYKSIDYLIDDPYEKNQTWNFFFYGGSKKTLYIVFDFVPFDKLKSYKLTIGGKTVDFSVK